MPPEKPKKFAPRKLLVAAVGVATINYLAVACGRIETSGNLPAPIPDDAGEPPPTSGNLPAPELPDTGPPPPEPPPTSGNLPAPMPIDAGDDAG